MNTYETVVGLEIHIELLTKSKIFCSCPNVFGKAPNSIKCPICEGLPGALPKFNTETLDLAIKAGLALNCDIDLNSRFDRKNYFYPDLPKGYQISQLYEPLCRNGKVTLSSGKVIHISDIHMEEDAAKLIHENEKTFVDYNRCGVPLIEIVTEADFRTADEVIEFLDFLRRTFRFIGVSDCKIEQGSMRIDVNLSVRKPGQALGTRTEMKNMASFKAITNAINHESDRQINLLLSGNEVLQETRRWAEDEGISYRMRDKEDYHDYKYFPEPDIKVVSITNEYVRKIGTNLPELPSDKMKRYMSEFSLTEHESYLISETKELSEFFEEATKINGLAKDNSNFILSEVLKRAEDYEINSKSERFSEIISMVKKNSISYGVGKDLVVKLIEEDIDPVSFINENGLLLISDEETIREKALEVLCDSANQKALKDYLSGNEKTFGFLMGRVMRSLGGKGDHSLINRILLEELNKKSIGG